MKVLPYLEREDIMQALRYVALLTIDASHTRVRLLLFNTKSLNVKLYLKILPVSIHDGFAGRSKALSEIAAQYKDRKMAIIAAYKIGTDSQREIGEFYQLHPTTIGVIARKNNDSGPGLFCACYLKKIFLMENSDLK